MKFVMIVDDSHSIREMVKFTLTQNGYGVVEAEDGVEALAIAKKTLVDAVIADVHMPNMDGIELIRQLRTLSGFKFIPILMLTTDSDLDHKQKAAAAGATGWLVKPFNPESLILTIKRVLQ